MSQSYQRLPIDPATCLVQPAPAPRWPPAISVCVCVCGGSSGFGGGGSIIDQLRAGQVAQPRTRRQLEIKWSRRPSCLESRAAIVYRQPALRLRWRERRERERERSLQLGAGKRHDSRQSVATIVSSPARPLECRASCWVAGARELQKLGCRALKGELWAAVIFHANFGPTRCSLAAAAAPTKRTQPSWPALRPLGCASIRLGQTSANGMRIPYLQPVLHCAARD